MPALAWPPPCRVADTLAAFDRDDAGQLALEDLLCFRALIGSFRHFCGMRKHGHRSRNTLLQQQLCRAKRRDGSKTPLHRPVARQMEEREQAHPLVMRHIG